ncbi:MAG: hypothetical protein IIW68_01595 [Lachnospiraceae bacterium]|nr:hypothetical protein [Lachnospiraceae bacterium]
MNLLNKLERKFGKYAIPNLMYYVVILYAMGLVISTLAPPASRKRSTRKFSSMTRSAYTTTLNTSRLVMHSVYRPGAKKFVATSPMMHRKFTLKTPERL